MRAPPDCASSLGEVFQSEHLSYCSDLGTEGTLPVDLVPPPSEATRAPDGKWLPGIDTPNAAGLNQFHPQVISRRRLALAVERKLRDKPKSVEHFADQVVGAVEDPKGEGNIELLKYALPQESRLGVELSGPDGGAVEIVSRKQWEGLSVAFGGRFAGDTELAVEQSDPSPESGAD